MASAAWEPARAAGGPGGSGSAGGADAAIAAAAVSRTPRPSIARWRNRRVQPLPPLHSRSRKPARRSLAPRGPRSGAVRPCATIAPPAAGYRTYRLLYVPPPIAAPAIVRTTIVLSRARRTCPHSKAMPLFGMALLCAGAIAGARPRPHNGHGADSPCALLPAVSQRGNIQAQILS